ncbi:CHAT domain-containing protein [Saccharothrix obliqua]|uniref:CHAT domain-containing protein n=1 Tax=Saccharothrix obliqua TaxID=2861747 RepID=UPI001C5D1990|nr:CHAT domain-containing protein [Saccharothrix obliqua]MBW4717967.1 CHAT domain-containing protein [Saccharothrix obliqua]
MVAVQVKLVDAGDLYVSWRWEHALDQPRVLAVPRDLVRGALAEWARAVPTPLPGETARAALERALTRGPLVDRDREVELTTALARALFPHQLAQELNALLTQGIRPHLRISPSPSTALVPWEALHVDEGERTVHNVDVSILPPATVRNAPGRVVSPFSGPVVGVLDPVVPGFGDASGLGSVLGEPGPDLLALAARMTPGGVRRADIDRVVLEDALRSAGRLLYVGHVTTGGHGLDARLHLSCGATTTGRAAPIGPHRPLTAADIALGHRPGVPRPWRIPNRVALVACDSGGETRFAEPSGLVAALVHGGAEYVVSTRWTLPTDAGLAALVPGFPGAPVLGPAVVAIDAAQGAANPVAALNAWQRERADLWEKTGDPTHSPVTWAAFSTAWAEERARPA